MLIIKNKYYYKNINLSYIFYILFNINNFIY